MPDITAAGTYTHETENFEFLQFIAGETKSLLFDGSLGGATVTIGYVDDQGQNRTLENGVIASLPASKVIGPVSKNLRIVVSGGPPNLNVIEAGKLRY
ncbi:MAG: hypothetical protein ABW134_11810 [Candidatus Thiodiazotropha endolucinida]